MTLLHPMAAELNLRDVGGLRTVDGGVIRPGRLYRSGRLDDLAPEARRELVEALGISEVVDLRQHQSGHDGVGVTVHTLHLVAPGKTAVIDPEDTYDSVADWYLRLVTMGAESLRRIVELVATSPGATLVHCHAGKDRTGSVVAVILSAAGVADDEVARDYSTTGTIYGDSFLDSLPPKFSESNPEAIARFLAKLGERYGSAAGFLEAAGVERRVLEEMRRRLVDG